MKELAVWIKQHQLSAFFILTYLTTWLLILPFLLTNDEQAFGIFVLIGIFAPAFLNIIISRVIEPVASDNTRRKRRFTFLVIWIIATVVFTFHVKTTSEIESPVAIVFYAIVGLLPAIVLASVFSRFAGVRKSLSTLLKPKGHIKWYLFALLFAPVIKLISIPITHLLGLEAISQPDPAGGVSQLMGLIAVSFLYGFFFTGGLNEETGWSGFALPRLQARYSPFVASIFLWFFWILWHMPMQITGYWNPETNAFIRALAGTFFARFIFTWLYNKTGGSILPPILLHVSANVSFTVLPVTHANMVLEALAAVFIIFTSRMWKRLPAGSPAMYCTGEGAVLRI